MILPIRARGFINQGSTRVAAVRAYFVLQLLKQGHLFNRFWRLLQEFQPI